MAFLKQPDDTTHTAENSSVLSFSKSSTESVSKLCPYIQDSQLNPDSLDCCISFSKPLGTPCTLCCTCNSLDIFFFFSYSLHLYLFHWEKKTYHSNYSTIFLANTYALPKFGSKIICSKKLLLYYPIISIPQIAQDLLCTCFCSGSYGTLVA